MIGFELFFFAFSNFFVYYDFFLVFLLLLHLDMMQINNIFEYYYTQDNISNFRNYSC